MSLLDCIKREKRLNKAIIDNRKNNTADLINACKEREINEIFSDYEKSNNKKIKAVG